MAVFALIYGLFTLRGTARRLLLFVLAVMVGFYCAVLILRVFGVDGSASRTIDAPYIQKPSNIPTTQTGIVKNKVVHSLPM